jgi:ElaB/YqjD/DUF883 family membrane-anchored ribosome-binding protein
METYYSDMEREQSATARERVMDDLRALSRDAEGLLKATAADISDKSKDARARLTATLERARSTCSDVQQQAVDAAKNAARKADQVVRTHPYQSIGIGFGIGLLIGVLVARK